MYSKLAYSTILVLISAISTPALSHSGHTSAPHIHNAVEFSILVIAIGFIIYRIIKR